MADPLGKQTGGIKAKLRDEAGATANPLGIFSLRDPLNRVMKRCESVCDAAASCKTHRTPRCGKTLCTRSLRVVAAPLNTCLPTLSSRCTIFPIELDVPSAVARLDRSPLTSCDIGVYRARSQLHRRHLCQLRHKRCRESGRALRVLALRLRERRLSRWLGLGFLFRLLGDLLRRPGIHLLRLLGFLLRRRP